MSEVKLQYQVAKIIYLEWYLGDLRVDFLLEDELNYELEVREIQISNDPNCTRRNRILRDRLKFERNPTQRSVYVLKRSITNEIEGCSAKCSELFDVLDNKNKSLLPKCQSRLLHLANRIQILLSNFHDRPFLTDKFRCVFTDVVNKTANFFYRKPVLLLSNFQSVSSGMASIEKNIEEVEGGEEDQGVDDCQDQNKKEEEVPCPTVPHSQPHETHSNSGYLICIRSLQERIADLEQQLAEYKDRRDGATQTAHVSSHCSTRKQPTQSIFSNLDNVHRSRNSNSFAHQFSSLPNVRGFVGYDASYPNYGINSQAPQVPQSGRNCSHCGEDSHCQPSHSWRRETDRSLNSAAVPNFSSNKSLPVSKWSLTKYDGEDQGLKLNEFLEYVHALSVAEHVGEIELFESAVHLFKGPALNWYMTMRTTGRLVNWQHLVFELRRTFMHPDLDALIKMKIYQRRQQKNESFNEFYYEMERLFRTMSMQIAEFEKVQIIQQNMRIDYKKQLNFLPIADLESLVAAGQKVDALNFSAYNKVFGSEKSVHIVDEDSSQGKPTQKGAKSKNKSFSQDPSCAVNNISQPSSSNSVQSRQPVNAQSGSFQRVVTTLETLIDKHRRPPSNSCFNCGKFGHRSSFCPLPRGVLCDNCGFRGYPTNNCPFCTKNDLSATENRRSLNHTA